MQDRVAYFIDGGMTAALLPEKAGETIECKELWSGELTGEFFASPLVDVRLAARLAKADLNTGVVYEFPELQGIMGREYARIAGEDGEVAEAILELYLPRFAEDRIPSSDIGAIVGIADKLGTIAGCFGVGLIPTGTADPYALRRQCLGIINIILGRHYHILLSAIISKSVALLQEKLTRPEQEVTQDVLNFFAVRFSNLLTTQGYLPDAVDAAVSCGIDDLADMVQREIFFHP